MQRVYGETTMKKSEVSEWSKRFKERPEDVKGLGVQKLIQPAKMSERYDN